MQKKVYKRLNDNTVLCIYKYNSNNGARCHNLSIYYENTNQVVEFGTYNVNQGSSDKQKLDIYSYNNDYIIGYKNDADEDCLKLDRMYDINNRCDLLTGDKFYDHFRCVELEEQISENKCKTLALGKFKKMK